MTTGRRGTGKAWVAALTCPALTCLALLAALSVFLVNGRGLPYFDTAGYLQAGDSMLAVLGWDRPPPPPPEPQPPAPPPEPVVADPAAAPPAASAPDAPPDAPPDAAQEGAQDATQDGMAATPGDDPVATSPVAASPMAAPPPAAPQDDHRTVGSRSAVYGLVLALCRMTGWLDAVVVLNVAVLWLALWLAARVVLRAAGRAAGRAGRPATVAASLILAGCAGSLPFYTAFLMPDILAPVLLLMLALLTEFFRSMRRWEIAVATLLALAAVLSHPAHLVMAVLLAGVGFCLSPLGGGHRLKLALILMGLVVGIGLAERLAFTRIVETVRGSQVFYMPFLTARLIDDGPGMDYLAAHCPDAAWATCDLYRSLADTDPASPRRDAPVILFSTDPAYGSYRLLPVEVQTAIAREQTGLALDVLATRPLAVAGSILRNTLRQLELSGIGMTIPTPAMMAVLVGNGAGGNGGGGNGGGGEGAHLDPDYALGRLTGPDRSWIAPVGRIHTGVYLLCLAGILGLLVAGRLRGRGVGRAVGRRMAAMVLGGILINALVCGAISEPADRYGARVMFLLPVVLGLLLWARAAAPRSGRAPA